MIRAAPPILLCVLLAACVSEPEIYPPPPQRKPLEKEAPLYRSPLLDMSDPQVEAQFVTDILTGPQHASWRWARKRPTVRIPLQAVTKLKYFIDFAIAEATFKDTGPVTITFLVNDKQLDRIRYTSPGSQVFEKAIPDGWLKPASDNVIAAEVDKVWVSATDGMPLGIIISRFGLVQ